MANQQVPVRKIPPMRELLARANNGHAEQDFAPVKEQVEAVPNGPMTPQQAAELLAATGGPPNLPLEMALQKNIPIPHEGDEVVRAYTGIGVEVGKVMRAWGDQAFETGKMRRDEAYRFAELAERKAEFQAREAGEFIDQCQKLRAIALDGGKQLDTIKSPAPADASGE